MEFKNFVQREFETLQERSFENLLNKSSDDSDQFTLFTSEGKILNGFNDIEGIKDPSRGHLGFIVASWTSYFMGLVGYDPEHGHSFQKVLKERQVRENIIKLEQEWKVKRNKITHSNPAEKKTDSEKLLETSYIWRNDAYRYRFKNNLGEMKPAQTYDPKEMTESPKRLKSPIKKLKIDDRRASEQPKVQKMIIQATANDLLSFDTV